MEPLVTPAWGQAVERAFAKKGLQIEGQKKCREHKPAMCSHQPATLCWPARRVPPPGTQGHRSILCRHTTPHDPTPDCAGCLASRRHGNRPTALPSATLAEHGHCHQQTHNTRAHATPHKGRACLQTPAIAVPAPSNRAPGSWWIRDPHFSYKVRQETCRSSLPPARVHRGGGGVLRSLTRNGGRGKSALQ